MIFSMILSKRSRAITKSRLKTREKLVLFVLNDYANNDGTLKKSPLLKELVQLTGLSERSIRSSLKHLEDIEVISIVKTRIEHGISMKNEYVIDFKILQNLTFNKGVMI